MKILKDTNRGSALIIAAIVIALLGLLIGGLYYFRTPVMMYFFSKNQYPVIVVSGTWEEMGYQIGSRPDFAKNIHRLASFLRKPFPVDKAHLYFDKTKQFIPESISEQMRGLAKGEAKALGIPYDTAWNDVLIFNFFMPSTYMKSCTAFAISSKDGSFLAHNTDQEYLYSLGGSVIIFKPNSGLGYPFVSFYHPGFAGVALGENAAGLAVLFNATYPGQRDYGLPPDMFVRRIMQECSTLEDAIEVFKSFIKNGGRFAHNGANLTFLDFKTNHMARIEIVSDHIEVYKGEHYKDKEFVVTTNHYRLMPEQNKRDGFNTSSYARYERCDMLLKTEKEITFQTVLKILSDHDSQSYGTEHTICRHRDLNMGTINFLAFDDTFTLYYIIGNPCRYYKDSSVLQVVHWKELLR